MIGMEFVVLPTLSFVVSTAAHYLLEHRHLEGQHNNPCSAPVAGPAHLQGEEIRSCLSIFPAS